MVSVRSFPWGGERHSSSPCREWGDEPPPLNSVFHILPNWLLPSQSPEGQPTQTCFRKQVPLQPLPQEYWGRGGIFPVENTDPSPSTHWRLLRMIRLYFSTKIGNKAWTGFALCWERGHRDGKNSFFLFFPKRSEEPCVRQNRERKKLLGNFGTDGWVEYLGGFRKDTGKDRWIHRMPPAPLESPKPSPGTSISSQGLSAMAEGLKNLGTSWARGHGGGTQEFREKVHRDPWGAPGPVCALCG